MANHNPDSLAWRRRELLQLDGRFSVAGAQSAFGLLVLYSVLLISRFPKVLSFASASLTPAFAMGAIVVAAGAVGRFLELRLVQLPARVRGRIIHRAQTFEKRDNSAVGYRERNGIVGAETANAPKITGNKSDAMQQSRRQLRFWSLAGEQGTPDIAVLQLCIGAGIVPVLSFFPASAPVAWRMVAVTVLSEVVYLAFLVARLIRLSELDDLAQAIEETQQQIQQRSEAREVPKVELKILQQTQDALFARSDVLWRQIGFMFDDTDDNKSPGGDQQQAHIAEAPKPNIWPTPPSVPPP